jgi:hypothetical protein
VALPVDPTVVGRTRWTNVAIGPSEQGEPLTRPSIVDVRNPVFFDHTLDHVPGHLLMEACRQNAIATAVRLGRLSGPDCLVTAFRAEFHDFAELDAPSDCRAVLRDATGHWPVLAGLVVRQLGRKVGDVDIELGTLPYNSS